MICECGQGIKANGRHFHERGRRHTEWAASQRGAPADPAGSFDSPARDAPASEVPAEVEPVRSSGFSDQPLPSDLQAIVESTESPQRRARQARVAYASRGWEAPEWGPYGSIEDFLKNNGVPIAPPRR